MQETKWLIAREIPRLRRYALALTRDPVAADDLVQDTLERAIRKRHLWSRHGSLRAWLYKMLYHVFLNQGPRRKRRANEVDLDVAPDPIAPATADARLVRRDIVTAMQELPAEQRAAIALTAVEGLSYDEAAARARHSRGHAALGACRVAASVCARPSTTSEPQLRQVK